MAWSRLELRNLRSLANLSPRGWRLLLQAWLAVGIVRAALWIVPFPRVRRLAAHLGRRSARAGAPLAVQLVENRAWAVQTVSRFVPRATCLVQALALQIILGRSGTSSELHIGVARGDAGGLDAHAWLEVDGTVVVGDVGLDRYTALPQLREAGS